jgi:ketosteroid isomerase-like protein
MKRTIVITALLVFAGCASTSTSMPATDVGPAIRALADEFDTQMRAGNVDGFMALYADDAVLMPPNAPAFNGRDAVRRFWGGLLATGKTDVDLIVDDVTSSGDLAIERGHYELTVPFKDSGKYIVVWRNRGGKWQIIDDIFNSSMAAPQ